MQNKYRYLPVGLLGTLSNTVPVLSPTLPVFLPVPHLIRSVYGTTITSTPVPVYNDTVTYSTSTHVMSQLRTFVRYDL